MRREAIYYLAYLAIYLVAKLTSSASRNKVATNGLQTLKIAMQNACGWSSSLFLSMLSDKFCWGDGKNVDVGGDVKQLILFKWP